MLIAQYDMWKKVVKEFCFHKNKSNTKRLEGPLWPHLYNSDSNNSCEQQLSGIKRFKACKHIKRWTLY